MCTDGTKLSVSPSYGEFNFTRLVRFSGLYYLVKNYQKIAVKIEKVEVERQKDAVEMQL